MDVVGYVVYCFGFGDYGFFGVEFDFYGLYGFVEDVVVEFVVGYCCFFCLLVDCLCVLGKIGMVGNG